MKKRSLKLLLLLLAALCVCPAYSQIGLRIVTNRKVYMQYEPVYACVTLRNNTGRVLPFGQDPRLQGFIYFLIRDSRGRTIAKRPGKEINTTGLMLKPGEQRNLVLPVNEYYELDTPGMYSINVCVAHNLLPRELKCVQEATFQIDSGIEVWSAKTGVPDLEGKKALQVAKERKYSIRVLTESPYKHYYLFVEDDDMVYGVSRVGREISSERFRVEIDMLGRIHLLMPMSSKVFHYLSFSIDGMNIANSYWRTSDTIPTLYRDPKTGIVRRIGGVAAKRGVDYVEYRGTPASKLDGSQPQAAEGLVDLNKDISLTDSED
ncbi:MAG: hypothetical protein IJC21_07105 [Lentisphaeria bacterium]|nr:hypothetical protein [Lentisphaeria bacterium]